MTGAPAHARRYRWKTGIRAQWVSRQADGIVALAVKNALASIYAVLPSDMRSVPDDDTFYVGCPAKAQGSYHAVRGHALAAGQVMWPIMPGL